MRANGIKQKWASGKATINGWLSIPNSFAAEVMVQAGWDSLTVDMQHGVVDYQAALGMLQAISTSETTPIVRVPWREPGIIMKSLDAGAYGVICPMVNSAEEAEELVSYCKYPPRGQRSFGPIRAMMYAGADYPKHANTETLAIAMIETVKALENLEEILATPGLDGIYVGPADLSNSMGFTPRLDPEEPKVVEAIKKIVDATKRHKVASGIHCGSVEFAKRMIGDGFNFVSMLSDSRLMSMKAAEIVKAMGEEPTGTQPRVAGY